MKAFPPRGYVNKYDWKDIHDKCDPGDAERPCGVHFIPHSETQAPRMFCVMSCAEHEYLLAQIEKVANKWEGIAQSWMEDYDRLKKALAQATELIATGKFNEK